MIPISAARPKPIDHTWSPRSLNSAQKLSELHLRSGGTSRRTGQALDNRDKNVNKAKESVPQALRANPGVTGATRQRYIDALPRSARNAIEGVSVSPHQTPARLTPAEMELSAALPAPNYVPAPPLDEKAASLAKNSQTSLVSKAQSRLQRNDVVGAQQEISLEKILKGKPAGHVIVLADEQDWVSVAHQYLAANRDYLLKNRDQFIFVSDSLSPNPSKGSLHEQRNFLPEFLLHDAFPIEGMDTSAGAKLADSFGENIGQLTALKKEIEVKRKLPGNRDAVASDQDVAKLKNLFAQVKMTLRENIESGALKGASKKEARKLLAYMKYSFKGERFTLATLYSAIDGPSGSITRMRTIVTEFRRGQNLIAADQQAVAQRLQQLAESSGKTVIYLSNPQKIFDVRLESKKGSDDAKDESEKKKYAFRQGFLGHLAASTDSQCTTVVFGQSSDTDFAFKPIELGRIIGGEEYKGTSTTPSISVPGKLFAKGWNPHAHSPDGGSPRIGSPDERSESSEDSE